MSKVPAHKTLEKITELRKHIEVRSWTSSGECAQMGETVSAKLTRVY